MTTGPKIRDQTLVYDCKTVYADGSTTQQSDELIGRYFEKTWSGGDYPATKPPYETYWLRVPGPNGKDKVIKRKRRADLPTRRRTEDHPYYCYITNERQSPLTAVDTVSFVNWATGSPVWERRYEKTRYQTTRALGYSTSVDSSSAWNSNDDIALLGKLREKVAGSDFNAGVFLGEGRQALDMISNSAIRIAGAIRAVKRGNLTTAANLLSTKRPAKTHKVAANNWLELQYGWIPLLSDAESAAQFLAKHLEFPMIQTYRVRRSKKQKVLYGNPYLKGNWGNAVTRVQLIARLEEVSSVQLSGLTDPLSIAWELTPWSFVADWFIPIGNYLAARSLAQALTGTFVTTKTTRFNFGTMGPNNTYFENGPSSTYSTDGMERKVVEVSRTISTSLSVPKPSFKPLGEVYKWKRAANSVALMTQAFGKGR